MHQVIAFPISHFDNFFSAFIRVNLHVLDRCSSHQSHHFTLLLAEIPLPPFNVSIYIFDGVATYIGRDPL